MISDFSCVTFTTEANFPSLFRLRLESEQASGGGKQRRRSGREKKTLQSLVIVKNSIYFSLASRLPTKLLSWLRPFHNIYSKHIER
jgi:hypothetical protein